MKHLGLLIPEVEKLLVQWDTERLNRLLAADLLQVLPGAPKRSTLDWTFPARDRVQTWRRARHATGFLGKALKRDTEHAPAAALDHLSRRGYQRLRAGRSERARPAALR